LSASLNSTNMCSSFPTHCAMHNKNDPLLHNLYQVAKLSTAQYYAIQW